jgi:hypothetical protein
VGGVDRPVPGDGPFSMTLKLKEGVTFDWRVIERLPVSSTKCGDTFIAAEGHDGTSYNETQFSEKTLRIFNFGDSTTLQSAADFDAALSTHNVTSSTVNARDTTATVNNVASWLTTPEPFDVIRWNNGYWDAQPLAGSGLPNVVTPPGPTLQPSLDCYGSTLPMPESSFRRRRRSVPTVRHSIRSQTLLTTRRTTKRCLTIAMKRLRC